ncbi:MAG: extracellular solute-binding protein [Anaerolineales bacterium]|nr:extracellular solute-binding protein [Anaerolineales bacterium]
MMQFRANHNRAAFNLLVVAAMLIALLAACAPAAPAGEDAAAGGQAQDAQTTITVWGWPAADVAYQSFVADFEAAHPEIKLDIQMMPSADEHDKLLASLAAGAGAPDVAMIEINFIDKFVAKGGLVDLLQEPFNAGQYEKEMVPYKWAQATTPDGRLVAFPWDIGPATFFYRRDLFEQAGLPSDPESVAELTSTWPGFLDVAKKLTNPDEQRWAIGSASDVVYSNFAHRNLFDADWNCAVNSERAVQLLTYAQDMRAAGVDAKVSNWSAEWQTMLGSDSIAMQYGGAWFGGFLKGWLQPEGAEWEGKWGIFEVPEDPGQNWGGSFLAIPEQSENKEAAWTFIEFALARADSQNKMFAAVDYFPAYIPAFDDPMYQEADPFFGGQQTRAMWVDIAANKIQPFITTPMDAQAEQIFMSYVNKALDQGLDPQTTLDEACIEIEQQTAPDKEEALKLRQ